MLPQKRTDSEETGGSRGGFEVRVIGGGSLARAKPPAAGAVVETGIVIGGRVLHERTAAEDGETPVLRLEVDSDGDELKAKSMSEVGPAPPRSPSKRRGGKRYGLQHWTLWMAAGCCLISILAVAGVMLQRKSAAKDRPESGAGADAPAVPVTPEEAERDFFVTHASELQEAAVEILHRYAAAGSAADVLPLIRDPERVKTALLERWKPWGATPSFAPSAQVSGGVDIGGVRPLVVLTGSKGDFSSFEVVFVREEGKLLLDWEATAGIGGIQISELKSGARAEGDIVRAVLHPADFFTREHPEEKFSSYKLADSSGENTIWAYVPVDSTVAGILKKELNENSFLMEKSTRLAGTFRVTGPVGAGGTQYLITEMLHKGWVSP